MQTSPGSARRRTFIVRVQLQDDQVQRVDVEDAGTVDRSSVDSLENLVHHLRQRLALETHRGAGVLMSTTEAFWPVYRSLRLRTVARPFQHAEQAAATRIAAALQEYMGLDPETAAYQARRSIFHRRERLLHESLILDLCPDRLHDLLDRMVVKGLEHVHGLPAGQGVLLLALHYSAFSSLLPLWLARATARGLFSHLTILLNSGPAGVLGLPASRVDELEAAALGRRTATDLLDIEAAPGATRQLVSRLRAGGAAMVLPDSSFLPATAGGAISVVVGRRRVCLPRGAVWLAHVARCPVVPVSLRPDGDTYALVFGPPATPRDDALAIIQTTIQLLMQQTVLADPAPWEGWLALPPIQGGASSAH